jgi:hypothetical protein
MPPLFTIVRAFRAALIIAAVLWLTDNGIIGAIDSQVPPKHYSWLFFHETLAWWLAIFIGAFIGAVAGVCVFLLTRFAPQPSGSFEFRYASQVKLTVGIIVGIAVQLFVLRYGLFQVQY